MELAQHMEAQAPDSLVRWVLATRRPLTVRKVLDSHLEEEAQARASMGALRRRSTLLRQISHRARQTSLLHRRRTRLQVHLTQSSRPHQLLRSTHQPHRTCHLLLRTTRRQVLRTEVPRRATARHHRPTHPRVPSLLLGQVTFALHAHLRQVLRILPTARLTVQPLPDSRALVDLLFLALALLDTRRTRRRLNTGKSSYANLN